MSSSIFFRFFFWVVCFFQTIAVYRGFFFSRKTDENYRQIEPQSVLFLFSNTRVRNDIGTNSSPLLEKIKNSIARTRNVCNRLNDQMLNDKRAPRIFVLYRSTAHTHTRSTQTLRTRWNWKFWVWNCVCASGRTEPHASCTERYGYAQCCYCCVVNVLGEELCVDVLWCDCVARSLAQALSLSFFLRSLHCVVTVVERCVVRLRVRKVHGHSRSEWTNSRRKRDRDRNVCGICHEWRAECRCVYLELVQKCQ